MERYPIKSEDISGKFITFLSGTRADFGKLKPLIRELNGHDSIYYEIIATGMHMLRRYGITINEIHKAGFDQVFPLFNQDSSTSAKMDLALAQTITQLSHFIGERQPDLLIVHGDRIETLAGAISANLNNTLVAHVEGGEVSGTVDESIRHAISKLAHFHFVANEEARARLLQLGEHENSIAIIGSPEVDIMRNGSLPTIEEVKDYYDISYKEYAVLIYHAVTTELDKMEPQVDALFSAIENTKGNFIVVEPNNDLGSEVIRRRLNSLRTSERFKIFSSLRFEYYLTLLKHASYIIGNSSSGVREAPVFGIPCVNVGSRQNNRARSSGIFNVEEDRAKILQIIETLPKRVPPSMVFGSGKAAQRFAEIILSGRIWEASLQKTFVDRKIL